MSDNKWRMYYPQEWPVWAFMGVLKLITWLPFTYQLAIGRGLGRLLHRLAARRRHIADVNIGLCFPHLSPRERQKLVLKTFEANGMGLMETAAAWFMKPERLLKRVTIKGLDMVEKAQAEGKPVLLLGAHYTTTDIAGTLLGQFIAFDVIYRRQKNPVINHLMTASRKKFLKGGRTIAQDDMRAFYRSLADKRVLWYPPDQDYGAKHSVFAPFFGVPAATIKAPTRMAMKSGAFVMACWYYRTPEGNYHLEGGPIEGWTGEDFEADATAINRHIEKVIRLNPEQYMWVHRRFKSRPEGEKGVY